MAPSDEGAPEPAPGVLGEPWARGKVSAVGESLCFDEKRLFFFSLFYFLCKVKLQGKKLFPRHPFQFRIEERNTKHNTEQMM